MPVESIEPFKIDSEGEADAFLKDLLSKPENRTMSVLEQHSQAIAEVEFRAYFIKKAKELMGER